MEIKKRVVGILTPEELAAFNDWRNRDQALEQASRMTMRALLAGAHQEKLALLKENTALFAALEKTYNLDKSKCFEVDYVTGELLEHEHHAQNPLAMILSEALQQQVAASEDPDPTKKPVLN